MTSAISLSGHLSVVGPRTGDRGGKDGDARGQGFADTLADAVGQHSSKTNLDREQAAPDRRLWLLDARDGTRMSLQAADAGITFGTWQMPVAAAAPGDAEKDRPAEATADDEAGRVDVPVNDTPAEATPLQVPALSVAADEKAEGGETPAGDRPPIDAEAAADADAGTNTKPATAPAGQPTPDPIATGTPPLATPAAAAEAAVAPVVAGKAEPARRTAQTQAAQQATDATSEPEGEAKKPAATTPPPSAQPARAEPRGTATPPASRADTAPPVAATPAAVPGKGEPAAPTNNAAAGKAGTEPSAKPADPPPQPNLGNGQAADTPAARVAVVAASSTPAPAPTSVQVLGPTSAGLVSEIAADPAWRSAAQAEAASPGGRPAGQSGVQSLRIQLQPVELGMVTARLTQTGARMSIEIQVESNDARHRLANDSEQIVKALKAVGIEVEKVTIQQAPQPTSAVSAQQQGATRDTSSQQQQQPSAESGAKGQGERGAADRQGEGTRHGAGETTADRRAGGGLYI